MSQTAVASREILPVNLVCRYYPKLQVCVPFSPVTGNRLLVQPGPLAATVLKALAQTLVTITGTTFGAAMSCAHSLVCGFSRSAHGHTLVAPLSPINAFSFYATAQTRLVSPTSAVTDLAAASMLLPLLLLRADEMGVSSLHVTFPTGEEWAALGALGFQQRKGIQFHWWAEGCHTGCVSCG
jgi:predicted N-acyltransferase